MIRSAFMFVTDTSTPSAQMILQVAQPHIIGHVWQFRDEEELQAFLDDLCDRDTYFQKVPGYRIVIKPVNSLSTSEQIKRAAQHGHKIEDTLKGMANFFLDEHIGKKPRKYEKYKTA